MTPTPDPATGTVPSMNLLASCGHDTAAARWLAAEITTAIRNAPPEEAIEETVAQAILYFLTGVSRFWAFVDKRDPDECWPWTGRLDDDGYGEFYWAGKFRFAYQISHALARGPRPVGMTIDHTCHTRDGDCPGRSGCPHRRCVNPAHLQPVTSAVNVLRGRGPTALNKLKTECVHGHPYSKENTRIRRDGRRACRQCDREHHKRTEEKRREARRLRKEKVA